MNGRIRYPFMNINISLCLFISFSLSHLISLGQRAMDMHINWCRCRRHCRQKLIICLTVWSSIRAHEIHIKYVCESTSELGLVWFGFHNAKLRLEENKIKIIKIDDAFRYIYILITYTVSFVFCFRLDKIWNLVRWLCGNVAYMMCMSFSIYNLYIDVVQKKKSSGKMLP